MQYTRDHPRTHTHTYTHANVHTHTRPASFDDDSVGFAREFRSAKFHFAPQHDADRRSRVVGEEEEEGEGGVGFDWLEWNPEPRWWR